MLDVFIGLALAYLLFSLLASTIFEMGAAYLGLRGYFLKKALLRMLNGGKKKFSSKSLCGKFLGDFRFQQLSLLRLPGRLSHEPSYLSARMFTEILLDNLPSTEEGEATISGLPDGKLKNALTQIWRNNVDDLEAFKKNIEQWYDDVMDRVTGWYKGHAQLVLLILGFCVACIFNADTVSMFNHLSKDKKSREQMVNLAMAVTSNNDTTENQTKFDTTAKDIRLILGKLNNRDTLKNDTINIAELNQFLTNLNNDIKTVDDPLGIGYEEGKNFLNVISFKKFFGWLLTAIAISLGATFWFDVLKKLVNIRMAGKVPEKMEDNSTPKS